MIATRPPDLLYVAFQTARQMIVNHIANIVFINAHAKSTGSTNNLQLSLHELLLNTKAINCRDSSVICRDLKSSHFTQPVCQLIGQLAAGKIYNPAAIQLMQPFSQPLPLLLIIFNLINCQKNIGTIDRTNHPLDVFFIKPHFLENIILNPRRGSGRQ